MTPLPKSRHLEHIDELRGIAILLVILGHIFGYAGVGYPAPFAQQDPSRDAGGIAGFLFISVFCNGFFGVMLFFVLSGFCIRWSHLHTRAFSYRDFYLRRTFRIYPAYLAWLGLFAVLVSAPWWDVLVHALLLHNFSTVTFNSIDRPLWSIALEWQIYLLYPLILLVARKIPAPLVLWGTAIIGVISGVLGSSTVQRMFQSEFLTVLAQLPSWLLFPWMLGFYQAEKLHAGDVTRPSLLFLPIILVLSLATEAHPKLGILRVIPWSLASVFLLQLFNSRADKVPAAWSKPLAFTGIVSYSIYLGHDIVGYWYTSIEKFLSLPRGTFLAGLISCAVCIPIMILIGWISYQILEKPGIRAGARLRGASR